MKTTIYCKPTDKGIHSFYLTTGNEEIFLFSQAYRKGVAKFFGQGVRLEDSFNYKKAHFDTAVIKTMDKLPMYLKYVEEESGIEILGKTKRKNSKHKSKCA